MESFWAETMNIPDSSMDSIDLSSTAIKEVNKALCGNEYHMDEWVSSARRLQDTIIPYHHKGKPKLAIKRGDLNDLLLILCAVIKSLRKRETYLEGKLEELENELDGQQMIKDDWVTAVTEHIPDHILAEEKSKNWFTKRSWK